MNYKTPFGQGFFGIFFYAPFIHLDTETEAGYDKYKSYDWKSSILWFPEMSTTNRKNDNLPRKKHTDYY